ncbi:MAG: N-acetyl-gamma-glutamyl-phosphate reductase [Candidatus Omnitrophota bacterium]
MIKVAVVGATGYAGEELLKILVAHPQVLITSVSAKIDQPAKINQIYPFLSGKVELTCAEPDFMAIIAGSDLAFLALPHRVSMEVAPLFLRANKKVIDLSADYRLKDPLVYERHYGVSHKSPQYLPQAVYGLPEVNRLKVKPAQLIANPGCFPTGILLGALPLLMKKFAEPAGIIADAKTGLSGAGREKEAELIPQLKDNFKAYKVDAHQHAPEINQELSTFAGAPVEIVFVPHLIPIKRGILSTLYIRLVKSLTSKEAQQLYQEFYQNEPFVKVLAAEQFPQLKDVTETNFCHIGVKVNERKKIAMVVTCIDNLVKGASGQAVQNMNIMYGFKETEGML